MRELDEASILIADELPPSIAAQIDWTKVRGFATDAGSRTYHTAILARSLGVPAVVGLQHATAVVQPGQLVAIDGDNGELILDPSEEIVTRARVHVDDGRRHRGRRAKPGPAVTLDGLRLRLDANIEFPDDLAARVTRAPKASGYTGRIPPDGRRAVVGRRDGRRRRATASTGRCSRAWRPGR
jgi:phosphotransferase system enzyme I (PtsI)